MTSHEHFLKAGRESLRLISKAKLFQSLQDERLG